MAPVRRDTRGIVDAAELFTQVDFRRVEPAEPLRRYVEQYWLIDWDLSEPYVSHVVPHPAVNIVFQRFAGQEPFVEVAGVQHGLFAQKLEGRGRVCGVKFRPGGYRPFAPEHPVTRWTGRRIRSPEVFPDTDPTTVLGPDDDAARVAALDAFLLALDPRPDPQADLATALVERIGADRSIRRVTDFARAEGMSVRLLQRLFAGYVGVGPKWVVLRHRIHEALERAEAEAAVDWAALAADLGYADQAHLVRDFTATVGAPPTAYCAAYSAASSPAASRSGTR
ncbi:AraC family transcriptional regulator [Streptomyces resistomycificus]|uniref:AraC family transcriptional regulator n=1 Tax=Streptomyces resistomycificus TaxID=67356 RepID=A0A0L8KS18_9ACTN|nr:helix-turn-helix domain-containing protein [Streptomyces resistomycificus]KOG28539.1 AraC family transcriptional regulator [Streptomyces resistomycificus]KUN91176.1 AraC family transcriptional regulator [Streptomyces resistomycificus]